MIQNAPEAPKLMIIMASWSQYFPLTPDTFWPAHRTTSIEDTLKRRIGGKTELKFREWVANNSTIMWENILRRFSELSNE